MLKMRSRNGTTSASVGSSGSPKLRRMTAFTGVRSLEGSLRSARRCRAPVGMTIVVSSGRVLMNKVDDRTHDFVIRIGQQPVAQVEDVAGAAAHALENVAGSTQRGIAPR